MVGRRKTLTPTVIVDFDGTLIAGNSLHIYMRRGVLTLLKKGRIVKAGKVCAAALARVSRLTTHLKMKETAFRHIGEIDISGLLRRLYRAEVVELIEEYRSRGYNILIASAAYTFYLRGAIDYDCVASRPGEPECRSEQKREKVGEWLARNHSEAAVVVTDHYDDLPLMTIPGLERVYLVGPSATTVEKCRAAGVRFELLQTADVV